MEVPTDLTEELKSLFKQIRTLKREIAEREDHLGVLYDQLERFEDKLLEKCEGCSKAPQPIMKCKEEKCPIAKIYVECVTERFRTH
ncbi:MAG: hypothetical protein QXY07_02655 [Candidatus Bathyarchaeia archaeon]